MAWGKSIGGLRCLSIGFVTLKVNIPPKITLQKLPAQCSDNPPLQLVQFALPIGGTWSSKSKPMAVVNNMLSVRAPNGLGLGTHWLTYTFRDPRTGCLSSDSVQITVNDVPHITLVEQVEMCSTSGDYEMTASPQGGQWTPVLPQDQKRIKVVAGRYYFSPDTFSTAPFIAKYKMIYSVRNNNKCDASDTMNITVYKTPVVKAGKYGPYCSSDGMVSLSGSPQGGVWTLLSGPSAVLSGDQNSGYFFDPSKAGATPGAAAVQIRLAYTASNQGHCPVTDSIIVQVNPLPLINFSLPSKICVSSPAFNLTATPAGGSFSGSNGIIGNRFDPLLAGVGTHTITYTYTDPTTQCRSSLSQSIDVNETPEVEITTSGALCEGSAYRIEARVKNSQKVTWHSADPNNGGTFFGDQVQGEVAWAMYQPSEDEVLNRNFTVYAIALPDGSSACLNDTATATFQINPLPKVALEAGPLAGCAPLNVQFTDRSTLDGRAIGIQRRVWVFGDGDSSEEVNPMHQYQKAGKYTVTLRVYSDKGCDSTLILPDYVEVYLSPAPDFGAKPQYTSISLPRIEFINQTLDTVAPVSYEWNFGDRNTSGGGSSTEKNPEYTYRDTGRYTVRLIAVNANGCRDTMVKEKYIYIQPELIVFVPNVFTPNRLGNEYNERFMVQVSAYSSYNIKIYNRWGELLYEGDNPMEGWDGNYKGEPAQEGAYVYVIKATDLQGKRYKYSGSVTILR
jgi:gliding motility-associated-like protein